MKRYAIFITLCLLTATVFAQPGKDKIHWLHGKKCYLHIVRKGETVYGISKDFNTAVKDIVLENPEAINGISPGDTLYIPVYVPGPVAPANAWSQTPDTLVKKPGQYIYHKVPPKETLYSLTREYKVNIAVLDSLNPGLETVGLKAGTIIRIPFKNGGYYNALTDTHDTATTSAAQAFKGLVGQLTRDTVPAKPPATLLNRYSIALMLTFSTHELDSITIKHLLDGTEQFPLLASISADFYDGIRLAMDALANQGFDANLYVYSIPMDSGTAPCMNSLLQLPRMAAMNLIIGPPYPNLFKRVANFAMKHQIPIVSPLSPDNSVLKNNPFVSKAVPAAVTETEQTADYIAMHYHNDNIIVVHNPVAANDNFFDTIKKRLNVTLSIAGGHTDSVKVADYSDDLQKIGKDMCDTEYNVIVVPYQGTAFVSKMVNQFANSPYNKDSLCVYGMHCWEGMNGLDPNNLDTLHLHYPSNTFIDYSSPAVCNFIKKYRGVYYSEPDYYSFEGYDMAMFYGSMLKKYGTAMQDSLVGQTYKGMQTSYNLYKPSPSGGIENKGLFILEYKDYTIVKDSL